MHDIFDNAPARKVEMDERAAASAPVQSWRDVIKVHPAAQVFPLMGKAELAALAADIEAHGLEDPVTLWSPGDGQPALLLDGRNRLNAMELVGIKTIDFDQLVVPMKVLGSSVDPFAYVVSANLHRRHLSSEQRRDSIAAFLKAAPEKSDRQIGKTIKADHKTVGAVRSRLEGRGEIPHVADRKDTEGRHIKAKKPAAKRALSAAAQTSLDERTVETGVANAAIAKPAILIARDDIGPASVGETARLSARISELENAKRRLEIEADGLRSEIGELKAAAEGAPKARTISELLATLLQLDTSMTTGEIDAIGATLKSDARARLRAAARTLLAIVATGEEA